ncbi:hypothetical protein AQZ52_10810 [Novosphingobium fuchskuhlense]|uniref:Uncharacterized protein n=1 Tax=Novosphingobium fuchskuhlense TaxID=1117702 RepID=A0A117UUL9_9SPHN|nr:hypothetical protein [Novosphingobium fuchskuhlense]KUR71154.1 hypothetical protein AQZ52_10810 [Novosphingobium fuchskuhlense]
MTDLPQRIEAAEGAEQRKCLNCDRTIAGHVMLCQRCFDDDQAYDDRGECANCGGEGVTYGCSWDWQCETYDEGEGTCLCERPCEWCAAALRARKDRGDGR